MSMFWIRYRDREQANENRQFRDFSFKSVGERLAFREGVEFVNDSALEWVREWEVE